MRTICSKCGYQFESVILDKAVAMKEILEKSTRHCQQKHPEHVAMVQQVIQKGMPALITATHFTEFIFIPEEETFIKESLDELKTIVMMMLGFDEEEEEDDENEGEETEEGGEDEEDDGILLTSDDTAKKIIEVKENA